MEKYVFAVTVDPFGVIVSSLLSENSVLHIFISFYSALAL